jgi:hypothetical protein
VPRRLLAANAAWMGVLWITRIKNANGSVGPIGLSLLMLAGAAYLLAVALRRAPAAGVVPVAVLHAGVWVVRGPMIAAADHPVGFIAVHETLAVISIALAVWLILRTREALADVAVGEVRSRSAPMA